MSKSKPSLLLLILLVGCYELPTDLDDRERISRVDIKPTMRDYGFPKDMVDGYVLDNWIYLNYPDAPERLAKIIVEHEWTRLFEWNIRYQTCTKFSEDFLAIVNNAMPAAPCGLISTGTGLGHKELFLFYRKPGERVLTILLADHRSKKVREFELGTHIMKIECLKKIDGR